MIVNKRAATRTNKIIMVVYCLILCVLAVFAGRKPAYNWDMLPYMGVILRYETADSNAIHSQVYNCAKETVPAIFYNRLIDPSNAYRYRMAQNPSAFYAQFPFYIVKPLYTRLAWLFYKAGAGLSYATVWPSVISWLLTGLLLFTWIKKYGSYLFACASGICIMLSPPLFTAASLSTPDALSGLLLFTAVYFLAEKKSLAAVFVFLLLAILTRIDNIVPAICFIPAIFLVNRQQSKLPVAGIVSLIAILLLACFFVAAAARSFGWDLLYYPSFVKQLNVNYTAGSAFDLEGYLALAIAQLQTGLYFSFTGYFLFLVLLLCWNKPAGAPGSFSVEQVITLSFVAAMVIRFLLQPLITDRLYIPWYLSVAVFLVKKYSPVIDQSNHYK